MTETVSKSTGRLLLLCIVIVGFLLAALAYSGRDQEVSPSCLYCGMDRVKFAHSRMYITYQENDSVGVCSLHCGVIELALKIEKSPEEIRVGDYVSHRLIDAEKAVWVIGGSRPGVMTRRAKWAFESKAEAEGFIREEGGEVASFEEAVEAAFDDMYEDVRMIRKKRNMYADSNR